MRYVILSGLLLLLPFSLAAAAPQSMQLLHRETLPPPKLALSDAQWRWLGIKREMRIATFTPDNPPFDRVADPDLFEGISADYSLLISRYLGLSLKVLRYRDRDAALTALHQQDVDLVLDDSGEPLAHNQSIISTQSFMPDRPTLVSATTRFKPDAPQTAPIRLALVGEYHDNAWINRHYPLAKVNRYASLESALASVAFGENDYAIGNLTSVSFLIERHYNNVLAIIKLLPPQDTGPRMLLRSDNVTLKNAVNAALNAIPPLQHKAIFNQWSHGLDLWQLNSPLNLTPRETRWISEQRQLRIVVDAVNPPFTMFDEKGQFHGISADVLRFISLRTGLNFVPVKAGSEATMLNEVLEAKGDLMTVMNTSPLQEKPLLFTRPYLFQPFVLVVRERFNSDVHFSNIKRLAVTADHSQMAWLAERYPEITLIEAANANVALQMVNEGKADGAVHDLMGARYMIDHYFRDQLKIAAQLGETPSRITFGVRRDLPELHSIINKVLADIPPRDISLLVNKWQATPNVKLQTWTLYRMQFYWLAGIFAMVVITSLVWIYYLRREIRGRLKMQLKLQEQATFHETLFNGTPVPVYVVNRHREIIDHNQAWCDFFRQADVRLIQSSLKWPLHPLAAVYPQLCQALAQNAGSGDARRYTVYNGVEKRIIIHQAVPFYDHAHQIAGLICSWQDITDHDDLLAALSVARERAEQANRAKSIFLATISHEIRTPVSAIIGLLELEVLNRALSDDNQPVHVAYESAQSLLGLIGDILDMAKIESGKLELAPEWVRFDQILAPVARVFAGLARQKNLMLSCESEESSADDIYLDPMRFRQVLSNLIGNAIKFTDSGTVKVRLSCVRGEKQDAMLELMVTDSGMGITLEEQKRLFTPFEQSESGKKQRGSGLGLAICHQLITMMGGTIALHSRSGWGTSVKVSLPVSCRNAQISRVTETQEIGDTLRMLKILIVDDHPANRLLLKHQLARLGHQVTEAKEGEQALQAWRRDCFDLIITDCSMPVMDGLTLTKNIRSEQQHPVIILGLTANAQPEERERCLAAGMDYCLFKPLRLTQLDRLLRSIFHNITIRQQACSLEQLVDIAALRSLTQHDSQLMMTLLQTTKDENEDDVRQADNFFKQQDWEGLAHCLHRLAGVAQIIGASQAESDCRSLESRCEQRDVLAITAEINGTLNRVIQLNQAIEQYIKQQQNL